LPQIRLATVKIKFSHHYNAKARRFQRLCEISGRILREYWPGQAQSQGPRSRVPHSPAAIAMAAFARAPGGFIWHLLQQYAIFSLSI
jgi:hypothetical protein